MSRKPLFLLTALALAFSLVSVITPVPAYAAACTSTGTGNWSDSATWDCGNVPQDGDDVTVAATHVVTVDTDTAALASLTVAGTVTFDETGTGRTMTVAGNLTVNSGGSFTVGVGGTPTTHNLLLGGDLSNNGTFNLSPASATSVVDITFNKTDGNQSITNGSYRLNKVTLDKGSVSNKVTTGRNVDVFGGANAFTWTAGTWEQTNRLLDFKSGAQSITANGALVLSGSGRANFPRDLTISGGSLTVNSTGTSPVLEVGRGDDTFEVGPGGAGGTVTLTAGDVLIQGQFLMSSGTTTLDGAAIKVDPQVGGNTLGGGKDAFRASVDAALTMSAGSVTLVDPNANTGNGRDIWLGSGAGAKSFTGGTIFLGDGVSSSAGGDGFEIRSGGISLYNLTVNDQLGGAGRTAVLIQDLALAGDLTLNAGGALDLVKNSLSVEGLVTNNGVLAQTRTINDGDSNVRFLRIQNSAKDTIKYFGVHISDPTDGTALGDVVVTIQGNAAQCTTDPGSPAYAQRCFTITPTNNGAATVRLYVLDSELNGIATAALAPYRWNGAAWEKLTNLSTGTATSSSGSYSWTQGDTASFSPFLAGQNDAPPTAVTLREFRSAFAGAAGAGALLGLLALAGGLVAARRRMR